ncbi:type II secretion system F family protein [Candidatus Leptofilum sp.]|uniref:type II secretion system F family protein n=1 Tax=Candidatus Leptofilum sp. TaxID=3241576 RepID=UPI003B593FF2
MQTATSFEQQLPDLMRHFEVALRSGYNIRQSFGILAQDLPRPITVEAQLILDALETEAPLLPTLDNWVQRTASRDLDLFVAAIKVQLEVGGNLADKLKFLQQILAQRQLT